MSTRTTQVNVKTIVMTTFDVPNNVFLLNGKDNLVAKKTDYGAWYIKFSTLYYIDKHGKELCIEGDETEPEEFEILEKSYAPDEFNTPAVKSDSDSDSESESESDSDSDSDSDSESDDEDDNDDCICHECGKHSDSAFVHELDSHSICEVCWVLKCYTDAI